MYGHKLRRWLDHKPHGDPMELDALHPAVLEGRTLFRARVRRADELPRVLIPGQNSRKIGGLCVKGRWAGMPIYTLTLEERASCPRTCHHWLDCMGNKMHWPSRVQPGAELEAALSRELCHLSRQLSAGFIVRLHVLGDFYSVEYVHLWGEWVKRHPGLRIFGYTAWPADSPIGAAIANLRYAQPERFWMRFSGGDPAEGLAAKTVNAPYYGTGIVCPAQTGQTECCGSCSLCWTTPKEIVFLRH